MKFSIPYETKEIKLDDGNEFDMEKFTKFYKKEHGMYGSETHFGEYYINSFKNDAFEAVVGGDIRSPQLPTFFCTILTNAILRMKGYTAQVNPTIVPIDHYDKESGLWSNLKDLIIYIIFTGIAFSIAMSSITYTLVKEVRIDRTSVV